MGRFIIISLFLFLVFLFLPATYAQVPSGCATPLSPDPARVSGGLVSTPQLQSGSQFYTSQGRCIVSDATIFAPFKIQTYDDLKSLYFTQSKATKVEITSLPATIANQTVYFAAGDLAITSTSTSGGTAVIFVEDNLSITQNYTYGTAQTGTVFVVGGNVNIDPLVTRIDAVIISAGTIYTAGGNCLKSSVSANQLVINGSLISLDSTEPVKFCRTLTDNSQPAEKINHQIKYLVILRNLLSDTLQRWSEIP